MKPQFQGSARRPLDALESRLTAYVAATGAAATALASEADAAIVANTATQAFGVNGDVNIDFNMDGQIDYQIDHDRYNLGGTNLDYLQIDKNDVNGAANPLPIDSLVSFPTGMTAANDTWEDAYVTAGLGSYPSALMQGTLIGPASTFDFQEGDNFDGSGRTIRANRLIDEDHTQIDQVVGGLTPAQVFVPTNGPNFLGLAGEVRYLGLKMDLNNTNQFRYGWVGIRIDNEADATGAVVGYAYETTPNAGILAGDTGESGDFDGDGDVDGADFLTWQRGNGAAGDLADGDANNDLIVNGLDLAIWRTQFGAGGTAVGAVSTIPEADSFLMAALGAVLLACWFVIKRARRKLAPVFIRR